MIFRKKLKFDVRESIIEIREDGELYTLEIVRDKDGTIWGVYPDKRDYQSDMVYSNGIRNLLIAFQRGILKLDDFPREKKEVEAK